MPLDVTTPVPSLPQNGKPPEEDFEVDSKDKLRRAVESLFNNLYGTYTCVHTYHFIYILSISVALPDFSFILVMVR